MSVQQPVNCGPTSFGRKELNFHDYFNFLGQLLNLIRENQKNETRRN